MKVRKGDVVVIRARADVWRDTTSEERDAHRPTFGCDGELTLAPQSLYRQETHGFWTVERARVIAPRSWSRIPGCVALRLGGDPHIWYTKRDNIHVVPT